MRWVARQVRWIVAAAVVVAAALLCVGAPATAAPPGETALTPCVARAMPGVALSGLFESPPKFDCVTPQTAFGSGDYWVRLDGVRVASGKRLSLRTASLWQDALTVAVRYADGAVVERRYTSATLPERISIGAIVDIPLPERASAPVDILVRIDGAANIRGILLAPRLDTQAGSAAAALRLTALYAAFAGLAIALLVYNFVLWLTLRYRFQLHYCLMIAATLGYALTSSSAVNALLPALANNDRLRLNYILLGLTASSALAFIGAFFEPRVVGPRFRAAIRGTITLIMTSSLAFAAFAPLAIWWLDRFYFAAFGIAIVLVPTLLWRARAERSRFLPVFVLAWSVPIAVTVMRTLHGFGLIPYSFWLDNGTVVSMGVESLFNAIAIAFRLRILVEERDRERAQKAAAEALARTDPLTGLDNRRALLDSAIGRSGPQRLMLVDIDHFRRVNDTIGHDGGDDVLRAFALALRKWAPQGALVARLGGEEFGLIVSPSSARAVDTLLALIRAQTMPLGGRITASIGVAEGPLATEEDWRALYRRADAALYRAKSDGRDRACITTVLPQAA